MRRPWLFVAGPRYRGQPVCREIGSADLSRSVTIPYTLASMATVARELGGVEPRLLDVQARRRGLGLVAGALREMCPAVLVQVVAYAVKEHDLALFRLARSLDPGIQTVCLVVPQAYGAELVREHPEVDVAIHSGDETALGPLGQAYAAAGRLTPEDLERIPGLAFRGPDGELRESPTCRFHYPGLYGSQPGPDLDLIDYPLRRYDKVVTYWSRGCPSRCIFCIDQGTRRTARSPEALAEELRILDRVHGVPYVDLYDRNILIHLDEVAALCEALLARRVRLGWTAFCRINRIDRNLARLMSAAGCRLLCVGLESASPRVLRDIRKGTNLAEARQSLLHVKDAGIRLALYLLFGLPEEDRDSIRETVAFTREVRPDLCVASTATPYEGTILHDVADREGLWAHHAGPETRGTYSLKLTDVKLRTRHLTAPQVAELRDEALAELRRDRWSPGNLLHLARRLNARELRLLAHPAMLPKVARRLVPYFTRRGF